MIIISCVYARSKSKFKNSILPMIIIIINRHVDYTKEMFTIEFITAHMFIMLSLHLDHIEFNHAVFRY